MRPRSGHACQFCGKTYSRREHFERHVRTHTGERPFNCSHCRSNFARLDTWRRHLRACHSIQNPSTPTTSYSNSRSRPQHEVDKVDATNSSPNTTNTIDVTSTLATERTESYHNRRPTQIAASDTSPNDLDLLSTWQWDPSLNLEPSFILENSELWNICNASASLPMLDLRPSAEPDSEQIHDNTIPRSTFQLSKHWLPKTHEQDPQRSSCRSSPSAIAPTEDLPREALSKSLQQRLPDIILPSTQILNRWIHIFITRLWHLIPVVHLPTFRPAETDPLLLLSICSLGALAEGSQDAVYHAGRLFTAVNKAILVSSTPYSRQLTEQTLAVLQAAVIGQTFTILSGEPSHLLTLQYYHGTLSVAIRAAQMALLRPETATTTETSLLPEEDWRKWISSETVKRLLHAVYIHNGEISAMYHAPASLRVNPLDIPTIAPDSLYLAKTCGEWASMKSRSSSLNLSAAFSLCATVECFIAEIGHAKAALSSETRSQSKDELLTLFQKWLEDSVEEHMTDDSTRISSILLCHSFFLNITCDLVAMEQFNTRDSPNRQIIRDWASSIAAKQGIVHAMFIANLLGRFRVTDVPAIHVARASWHAGLVLAVFSICGAANDIGNIQDLDNTATELAILRKTQFYMESDWDKVNRKITPERCRSLAFSLASTLRHLGPWRNASRYSNALEHILNGFESG